MPGTSGSVNGVNTKAGSTISPLAGLPPPADLLLDVDALMAAYADVKPSPEDPAQRVRFGTSGHRGSALCGSFNDGHVAAIVQAVCDHRRLQGIDGPLFLGADTHALSEPAQATALEVLAANGVAVRIAGGTRYTPTPAVSLAILNHRAAGNGAADGIVVTPSHNPPEYGGIKYNPPSGGPASAEVTAWIEQAANRLLAQRLTGVRRVTLGRALEAVTTGRFDFLDLYVKSLPQVIDMDAISASGLRLGIDPLGGAGLDYWHAIAERFGLDLDVMNDRVDPTFRFVHVDGDGRIRMDPSSPHVMQGLVARRAHYDVAAACDADHDRHGIVTRAGLMPANDYLCAMAAYLCTHRPRWPTSASLGRTAVTSRMLDRIARRHGRPIFETPVGFKWFSDGLLSGAIAFAGEESAGAAFSRLDGTVWTTDKDGITAVLLAAEMTARTGRDPSEQYAALCGELGHPLFQRIDFPATAGQKASLERLDPERLSARVVAGEPIDGTDIRAAGNGEPLGGMRVRTAGGWFAVRPSGTEDLCKLYAESFLGEDHLRWLVSDARSLMKEVLAEADDA